jgi:curved DNA-binding protein CbpA
VALPGPLHLTSSMDNVSVCNCHKCGDNVDVLGLTFPVSFEEVTTAYRDLAKVWHPDRFESDPRLRNKAEEKFKAIQAAFNHLKEHSRQKALNPPAASDLVHVEFGRVMPGPPPTPVRADRTNSNWTKQPEQTHGTERRQADDFDLSPQDALRIFRDAIDGRTVKLASTLSFPQLLLAAQEFGAEQPDSIRLLIGSDILLSNSRFLRKGFFNGENIPYSELCSFGFTLKAQRPDGWDKAFDKLVGRETSLLHIEGRSTCGFISGFAGGSDTLTMSLHTCLCQLQAEIEARRH